MQFTCRSCGSSSATRLLSAADVPVENSRLYDTAAEAAAVRRGDLVLERCDTCGFVQNSAFDPALVIYDDDYEDSQGHSAYFRAFADRVIKEMLDRYQLRGERAIEIGCGRGDFLRAWCAESGGSGIGIDPSSAREEGVDGPVEIRAETYRAGSGHHDASVIICRHTLEHVADVADFLAAIRSEFDGRPDTVMYLEIPDTGRIAHEGAFWDLYYEHCSYLDRDGLADLLRRTGWEPVECRLDYDGQYLVAHARIAEPITGVERRSETIDFAAVGVNLEHWTRWADRQRQEGRRIAVWAASSKAVAFLSNIPALTPVVAVDINPAKTGRFLPGSALAVCEPADLAGYQVDTVLVMNPVYLEEITADMARLGIDVELVAVGVS